MLFFGITIENAERHEIHRGTYKDASEPIYPKQKFILSEIFKYLPKHEKDRKIPESWEKSDHLDIFTPKNTKVSKIGNKYFLILSDLNNQVDIQEMIRIWGTYTREKNNITNNIKKFCDLYEFKLTEPQFFISSSLKFSIGSFEIKNRFFSIYELYDEMKRFSDCENEILHLQNLGINFPNFYITGD